MSQPTRKLFLVLALGGAFLVGRLSQGVVYAGTTPSSPYKKLNLFGKVLAYVENNYVEEVTEEQLIYGAIQGMLSSLDPHTVFLPPERYAELRQEANKQGKQATVRAEVLSGGVGYLKVSQFQEHTARDLEEALSALESAPGGLRGLILDLRDNPGGLLAQAVQVADAFLSEGVIVSTEGKNASTVETFYAHSKKTHAGFPMVVLVNAGSASASEIVAAALQDHKRAILVGTTTFGKGSVQKVLEFEDGSALKLTIARYFTPEHRSIQELGVSPDLWAEDQAPPSDGLTPEAALPRHLKNPTSQAASQSNEKPDYPLSRAIEYLAAWQTLSEGVKRPKDSNKPE